MQDLARDCAPRALTLRSRPGWGTRATEPAPVAQRLHLIVQEHPGIHFRELARRAGLTSAGQLRHHLDRLARQGLVIEIQDGRFKRFFVAAAHGADLRPAMARFTRSVPRRIGKLLLSKPMNRTELRRSLDCADSTLGYHLNRMLRTGDLARCRGRTGSVYTLTDEDMVRRVLSQAGANGPEIPEPDLLAAAAARAALPELAPFEATPTWGTIAPTPEGQLVAGLPVTAPALGQTLAKAGLAPGLPTATPSVPSDLEASA